MSSAEIGFGGQKAQVSSRTPLGQFSGQYRHEVQAGVEAWPRPCEVCAVLRREGLYSSRLAEWRRRRDGGALPTPARGPRATRLGRDGAGPGGRGWCLSDSRSSPEPSSAPATPRPPSKCQEGLPRCWASILRRTARSADADRQPDRTAPARCPCSRCSSAPRRPHTTGPQATTAARESDLVACHQR